MSETKTPRKLGLWLAPIEKDRNSTSPYKIVNIQLCGIKDDSGKSDVRFGGFDFEDIDNLSIQAFLQWENGVMTASQFCVEYRDIYSCDLRKAKTMFDTLKKAEKVIEKFPIQPTTFGQFAALFCAGFAVKYQCGKSKHDKQDDRTHIQDAKYLQSNVDGLVSDFAKLVMPEAVAA